MLKVSGRRKILQGRCPRRVSSRRVAATQAQPATGPTDPEGVEKVGGELAKRARVHDRAVPRLLLTDFTSPAEDSKAGRALAMNLKRLKDAGFAEIGVKQNVDAMALPDDLKTDVALYLLGSPAPHDPTNNTTQPDTPNVDNVRFKDNVFNKLCWESAHDAAVVMTHAASACGRLEFWTLPHDHEPPTRILVVAPAYFSQYKPRRGHQHTLQRLSYTDSDDTMVAMYLPSKMMATLQYRDFQIDVAASIRAWTRPRPDPTPRVITFGAFTAELEANIFCPGGPSSTMYTPVVASPGRGD